MSSEQDRMKRRNRRRNKYARDLRANPYFKPKVKDSRKVYDREEVKREMKEELKGDNGS